MIRKFGLLLAGLMLTISVFAQSTWEADPYHSKLTFSTTHLGIADIAGLFESFEAKIVTDKDDFSDAVFELTVDISSINTAVKMRDDHLRSERSEEHTSELQSRGHLVCRLLLEKKKAMVMRT